MKPCPRLATAATIVTTFFLALGAGRARAADTVVQIPMTGVLDARWSSR